MSIVTADNFAVLGINGIDSFFKAFGEKEMNSIQIIDETFIEKLKAMETHLFGFTEVYKVKFLKLFEGKIGKKCYLSSQWLIGYDSPQSQNFMKFVKDLDDEYSDEIRKCRVCGCTEMDCTQCIEKDGHPCWWIEHDLCSSCVSNS